MRLLVNALLCVVALVPISSWAKDSITVSVEGQAHLDKPLTFSHGDTLGKLVSASVYEANAYPVGAALVRHKYVLYQSARRLMLQSTLKELDLPPQLTHALQQQIAALEVTGRVPHAFDWDVIEVRPKQNRKLFDGDSFYVPARPDTISVVGAVDAHKVAFKAGKTVADYMADVQRLSGADLSDVWVIAPDTHITKVGIAYWNEQKRYVAPGSYLYVPISGDDEKTEQFQQSLRRLLASQILP